MGCKKIHLHVTTLQMTMRKKASRCKRRRHLQDFHVAGHRRRKQLAPHDADDAHGHQQHKHQATRYRQRFGSTQQPMAKRPEGIGRLGGRIVQWDILHKCE